MTSKHADKFLSVLCPSSSYAPFFQLPKGWDVWMTWMYIFNEPRWFDLVLTYLVRFVEGKSNLQCLECNILLLDLSSAYGVHFACRLRVTKATANQGREFYACPNGRPGSDGGSGNGCNYFLWADSVSAGSQPTANSWNSPAASSSGGRRQSRLSSGGESGVSVGHVPMWPPPASTGLRGQFISTPQMTCMCVLIQWWWCVHARFMHPVILLLFHRT